MQHSYKQLLTIALLAGAGLVAVAQTPPAQPAAPGAPAQAQRDARPGMGSDLRQQRHAEFRARRLAAMKQKLGITAAQEAAWASWTAALQPQPRTLQRPDRVQFEAMTTPERIDRMRALRAERMAQLDRRGDATKAFYAALDAEQRKLFDEMSLRMGKRGGHRGHHGFGRG